MINIIVAIQCEAKPLLHHYGLKGSTEKGPFRIYEGDDMRLLVSGIGKIAAAAACSHVATRHDAASCEAWLNIGTAGHMAYPVGQGILANKITDAGNGLSWYPPRIFDTAIPGSALITVDRPELEYNDTSIYEMEAAGFYATATRFGTSELIHCYKVISDNRTRPASLVTKGFSTTLIEARLPEITTLIQQLSDLSTCLGAISEESPALQEILDRWRFTTYEQNRLRHLARRWQLLCQDDKPDHRVFDHCKNGKEVLDNLQALVDDLCRHGATLP